MSNKAKFLLLYIFSFALVSLSQPDWSPFCCILSAIFGFALFWKGLREISGDKKQGFLAALWFFGIQTIQLSWLASDHYVGPLIYVALLLFSSAFGVAFGFFSLFVLRGIEKKGITLLSLASLWTLFEWGRLFFLSGFTWNPLGLILSGTLWGLQFASLAGVFGMTFWILLTNLLVLKAWLQPKPKRKWVFCSFLALFPYLYGSLFMAYHHQQMQNEKEAPIQALLVQAALSPEQKTRLNPQAKPFTPYEMWMQILSHLKPYLGEKMDMIVFSEAVVPYGTYYPLFSLSSVKKGFEEVFNLNLPSIDVDYEVGNGMWAQSLASLFNTDVVIGLEDLEEVEGEMRMYNAAFLFHPDASSPDRYEKRILLPMAEYIPFDWCKKILKPYGIVSSCTPGEKAKVFNGQKCPLGISICYEETFGNLMRENSLQGAKLLLNLTNDVWYPRSRLPMVHFLHGRLRAVEGGIPLLRACNTGVTCGLDSLGRVYGSLPHESSKGVCAAGVLSLSIPSYTFTTFYQKWGDAPLIIFSLFCVALYFLPQPVYSSAKLFIYRSKKLF